MTLISTHYITLFRNLMISGIRARCITPLMAARVRPPMYRSSDLEMLLRRPRAQPCSTGTLPTRRSTPQPQPSPPNVTVNNGRYRSRRRRSRAIGPNILPINVMCGTRDVQLIITFRTDGRLTVEQSLVNADSTPPSQNPTSSSPSPVTNSVPTLNSTTLVMCPSAPSSEHTDTTNPAPETEIFPHPDLISIPTSSFTVPHEFDVEAYVEIQNLSRGPQTHLLDPSTPFRPAGSSPTNSVELDYEMGEFLRDLSKM